MYQTLALKNPLNQTNLWIFKWQGYSVLPIYYNKFTIHIFIKSENIWMMDNIYYNEINI